MFLFKFALSETEQVLFCYNGDLNTFQHCILKFVFSIDYKIEVIFKFHLIVPTCSKKTLIFHLLVGLYNTTVRYLYKIIHRINIFK